jgi:hypothetical protein
MKTQTLKLKLRSGDSEIETEEWGFSVPTDVRSYTWTKLLLDKNAYGLFITLNSGREGRQHRFYRPIIGRTSHHSSSANIGSIRDDR